MTCPRVSSGMGINHPGPNLGRKKKKNPTYSTITGLSGPGVLSRTEGREEEVILNSPNGWGGFFVPHGEWKG